MKVAIALNPDHSAKVESGEWVILAVICYAPNAVPERLEYIIPDGLHPEEVAAILKKFKSLGPTSSIGQPQSPETPQT